ncbi:MAG: hypothetical protein RIC52_00850, partial [Amphiplicatus sp.]
MRNRNRQYARRGAGLIAGAIFALAGATSASAGAVNLSAWTATPGGNWTVAADQNSVFQSVNGAPTIFYSNAPSQGLALSGTITVETTGDDDFIGFVLGYGPEDTVAGTTDFILIDWKQTTQNYFGVAPAGLAISRVTAPLGDNATTWSHIAGNGVTELARANTLGSTGWVDNQTYTFELTFTDSLIEVYVNDVLELSVIGSFSDGGFGFYNYSQASVRYAGITEDVLPPPDGQVPIPGAMALMLSG